MIPLVDIETFRLPSTGTAQKGVRPSLPPKRKHQTFIRGPIPMDWLSRVAVLPGKAPLLVTLMLFHIAGLRGTHERLPLCAKRMRQFGIRNVQTVRKALAAMEAAGLVSLERHPGRCRHVTIVIADLHSGDLSHPGQQQSVVLARPPLDEGDHGAINSHCESDRSIK